jgi:hypothetical protein
VSDARVVAGVVMGVMAGRLDLVERCRLCRGIHVYPLPLDATVETVLRRDSLCPHRPGRVRVSLAAGGFKAMNERNLARYRELAEAAKSRRRGKRP